MEILNQFDIVTRIAIIVLASALLLQMLFYFVIYLRPVCRKDRKCAPPSTLPPVSVIVCARNECEALKEHLPELLTQDYPQFEVIVVNYCSEDETEEYLVNMRLQYPNLRSTIIRRETDFINNKKFAESIGIKAARYEWMLFTDANCRPNGKLWIRAMSRFFTDKKELVLGYSGFSMAKGLLNKWIQYSSTSNALQYLSFALCKMPYTGIDRNLAYRKSLFMTNNGFAHHTHIVSGANDLVVTQASTRNNVAVCLSPDGHITAPAKRTFREWVRQQCGYYSVLSFTSGFKRLLLWLEPLSRVLLWGAAIAACLLQPHIWYIFAGAFTFRAVFYLIIFGIFAKKLGVRKIAFLALFFDIFAPFVFPYIYLINKKLTRKWR